MLSKIKNSIPAFFSLEGKSLTDSEAIFFKDTKPCGFILFGRNCDNQEQLSKLTSDLREIVGWYCPVLIDQEGGRVQRMAPPNWEKYPPAKFYNNLAKEIGLETALVRLEQDMRRMARDLNMSAINVNCAPVADILFPQTDNIIGDRAYGDNVYDVVNFARVVCKSFIDEGVMPVIKHIAGHGRADCDSHKELPVVSSSFLEMEHTDFKVFADLYKEFSNIAIWGMVAHIIYESIDRVNPASVSPELISNVIRGYIGFDGLLITDDISMNALKDWGSVGNRAKISLQSGCDIALYCSGKIDEMEDIANNIPKIRDDTIGRFDSYLKWFCK